MGINFLLILVKVIDLSFSVSFLLRLEFIFFLEKTSNLHDLQVKELQKQQSKLIHHQTMQLMLAKDE